MNDLHVTIHIRRPLDVVRRWWLEFPEVYENDREQPHRIVTRSRSDTHIDTLTYWRTPMGEKEIPERFTLLENGWLVDVGLPLGLAQRDTFVLTAEDEGTRVDITVDIWATHAGGKLALPFWRAYARRSYPKTWRAAARWCERATQSA